MKLLSWIKKHIFLVLFLIFIIIMTVLCLLTKAKADEILKSSEDYRQSLKSDSVSHCKEKYGFEPEVKLLREDDDYMWMDNTLDKRRFETVIAKDPNRHDNFSINIFSEGKTKHIYDSWQFEDIKKGFESEINKAMPKGKLYYLKLEKSADGDDMCYQLENSFEKYYDGSDLGEVIEGYKGSMTMFYYNMRFDNDKLFEGLEDRKFAGMFVSFNDEKIMNEAMKQDGLERKEILAKYLPYINSTKTFGYRSKFDDKREYKAVDNMFRIKDSGEFFYSPFDKYTYQQGFDYDDHCYEKYDEIDLETLGKDDYKGAFRSFLSQKAFDDSLTDVHGVLHGWTLGGYVYFPLEKANGLSADDIEAAWIDGTADACSDHSSKKGIVPAEKVGNFAVFEIPRSADAFMLIDKNKNQ